LRVTPLICNLLKLICTQIALGVIVAWTRTIYTQFELLAGKSAPHDFLQLIVYKAMTFSDEIEKIDTVRAYHVCHQIFGLWHLIKPVLEWPCPSVPIMCLVRYLIAPYRIISLKSTSLWMQTRRYGRLMISVNNYRIK